MTAATNKLDGAMMTDDDVLRMAAQVLGNPLLFEDLKQDFTVHTEAGDWIKFARALHGEKSMLIRRIEGATRNLGAPADWDGDISKCNVLPILDIMTDQGPLMVSSWEPTPAELAALNAGASVNLWIAGSAHPVVSLTVSDVDSLKREE